MSKNLYSLLLRTLSAVYEVVGHRDAQDKLKAEELFRILDENSDGKSWQDENMMNCKQNLRWDQSRGVHKHYQARSSAAQHPGEDLRPGVMSPEIQSVAASASPRILLSLEGSVSHGLRMTEAIPAISQSHLHVFTCYGCTQAPLSLPIISFSTIFKNINVKIFTYE